MNNFRISMVDSNLHDLGYKGDIFTWSNRHVAKTSTKERLDKALANMYWSQLYPWVRVKNLVSGCFDHRPILASCNTTIHIRGLWCEGRIALESWVGASDPLDRVQK